ncbi:LysM peptidoglycan-binding domain-containing protein [Fructilactobacillus hinvesii]|uniref:LysM peptidoglycan-binding domain-containing protein n=1 Tax=Fructilactobacillus hinvesii TaxID=2940300 RepID=A0ABY5BTT8_9LACO|nr:LysM peptidoglycan-binding domain-containing protein [Fructilactobacillus hinvesii]USS88055.1 LysM peptidoglycan-binding domain-containing protein [Fructilactobacillus hinvesii]
MNMNKKNLLTGLLLSSVALGVFVTANSITTNASTGSTTKTTAKDKPVQKTITIQPGDTVSQYAVTYNSTVKDIADLNKLPDANLIYAGAQITIPVNTRKPGESIYAGWNQAATTNGTKAAQVVTGSNYQTPATTNEQGTITKGNVATTNNDTANSKAATTSTSSQTTAPAPIATNNAGTTVSGTNTHENSATTNSGVANPAPQSNGQPTSTNPAPAQTGNQTQGGVTPTPNQGSQSTPSTPVDNGLHANNGTQTPSQNNGAPSQPNTGNSTVTTPTPGTPNTDKPSQEPIPNQGNQGQNNTPSNPTNDGNSNQGQPTNPSDNKNNGQSTEYVPTEAGLKAALQAKIDDDNANAGMKNHPVNPQSSGTISGGSENLPLKGVFTSDEQVIDQLWEQEGNANLVKEELTSFTFKNNGNGTFTVEYTVTYYTA